MTQREAKPMKKFAVVTQMVTDNPSDIEADCFNVNERAELIFLIDDEPIAVYHGGRWVSVKEIR